MKLISMTSFVLEQNKILETYVNHLRKPLFEKIVNYAKFLKQPLKLEMFVPCDEEGNVLEEPKRWKDYLQYPDSFDGNKEWDELYDYQQAKEKVLFEGFELVRFIDKENPCYVVSNGENEVTFHIGLYNFSKGVNFAKTIEDLIHIQPILTESAIKQIGL